MKRFITYILGTVTMIYALALPAFAVEAFDTKLDVVGTKATPYDGAVKVEWTNVTDAVNYTVWYDTKAPEAGGESPANATTEAIKGSPYIVKGLTNDTKYYFTVTAANAAGTESESWSDPIANATPTKAAGPYEDKDSPQLAKAEALNSEEVKVTFSEAIVLQAVTPENAFVIESNTDFSNLIVKGAIMDPADTTSKTVILTTDKQTKDTDYTLTVSTDVRDKAGNPIISGSSSTTVFKGSAVAKVTPDTAAPEVSSVEVVDNTHVIVSFNEGIKLDIDPTKNFSITEEATPTAKIEVVGAELGKNSQNIENSSVVLTTSSQNDKKYLITVAKVKDNAGNEIGATKNTGTFQGVKTTEVVPPAVIAPEDIAKFLAKKIKQAEKYTVQLSWSVPSGNTGKVTEQLLYSSDDKGQNYEKQAALGPEANSYDVKDLTPGEYWFKVTQKANDGTETKGSIIKVILAKTGPEMLGLVLFSIVAGRVVTKKKKK